MTSEELYHHLHNLQLAVDWLDNLNNKLIQTGKKKMDERQEDYWAKTTLFFEGEHPIGLPNIIDAQHSLDAIYSLLSYHGTKN